MVSFPTPETAFCALVPRNAKREDDVQANGAHTGDDDEHESRVLLVLFVPGRLLLRDDIRFHRTQHGQQCVLVCCRNAGRVKRLHEILDQRIEVGAG